MAGNQALLRWQLSQLAVVGTWLAGLPDDALRGIRVGVWGRKQGWDHQLREGDRVEIYRPLLVDPKVARRERFQKQGARTAGLFAKRRPEAKAGY